VTDPTVRDRVVRQFRESAGPDGARLWFSDPGPLIAIRRGVLDDTGESYDRWVRDQFDAAAGEYGDRVLRNPVERRYREWSIALLTRTFPDPVRLLEVGCGTGAETLPMLRAGHRIVAIDVSPAMISRLEQNARPGGLAERLSTRLLRARDLETLAGEFGPASFDGGYSTFGALNLEPDLRPVARGLGRLLRPGAAFVAGVFSRDAILEPAVTALRGHPELAAARRHRPAPVGSHRFSTDVYLRSVEEVRRTFEDEFTLRSVVGLGLALPPPNWAARLERARVRWDRLERWDRRLGSVRALAGLADQFLAVLVRNSSVHETPHP
jgi:SAM-dependent methyltransferase